EQLQCQGGLSQNADGFGAAYLNGVGVALVSQNVGDAVDGGFEPDGITGGRSGNDQLQPMLGAAAKPDEAFLCCCGCLLFGADRVSGDDGGFQQGLQPSPCHCAEFGGELGIHPAGLRGGEVPGGSSDPPGLVGRHLTGQHSGPDQPQPVPQ